VDLLVRAKASTSTAQAMARKSGKGANNAASKEAVAAAPASAPKKRPQKKARSSLLQHTTSLLVLVAALVATLYLTKSPTPPPKQPPTRAATTAKRGATQDLDENCKNWADDLECENNKKFMAENCPASCEARRRPLEAQQKPPPQKQPPKGKKTAPDDKHEHCPFWATSGECTKNPTFMLEECATSCSDDPEPEAAKDIHQDCTAWVSDGECYRNPAFMLQQCKASCAKFAESNSNMLQDTSDTCVNFALRGECDKDLEKASTQCRASCHIQRICGNHTDAVFCQKALRCEAITDKRDDCGDRARKGLCLTKPASMLRECLKSCSEEDLAGMMRFHLPHKRTTLSPLIDLPGSPPKVAGFYSTPPNEHNTAFTSLARCPRDALTSRFDKRLTKFRRDRAQRRPWGREHWHQWNLLPGRERTPRVPHQFRRVPAQPDDPSSHNVTVEQVSYSPRIRYLHRLLSAEECDHVIKVASPLFSPSPVRGSVTRVRTSTTAMLGSAAHNRDPIIKAIRDRIARFSGYPEPLIEPLQVVRYQQGQKYDGHHDFFDVCDLDDKQMNGRRQVTFLIYLVDMPAGEEGGGTGFPDLKLEVAPERGSAVVFNDCFDNGEEDGRSLHAGLAPRNPDTLKMAINGWIRSHPVGHMNF